MRRLPAGLSITLSITLLSCFLSLAIESADAQSRAWTIDPAPTLRVGNGASEAEQFQAVVGATRLPNGHVLVGDRGDYSLLVFDERGAPVRKFGRKGKGPGEVSAISWLLRCGDTVVTSDITGSRVSMFSLNGDFVRSFRFTGVIYRSACGPTGRFVHYAWERDQDSKAGIYRALVPFWITRADSASGVPLGRFPGSERFNNSPLPVGKEPRVAIGRTHAYVALADSVFVRTFTFDGKEGAPLRLAASPVASTIADKRADMETMIAIVGEKARNSVETLYSSMPYAKTLPATRDLVVDTEGNLWVQRYPRGGAPTVRWDVFAPGGVVLASLQLPSTFELYEVGRDYVLGRYIDPNEGIPEVRSYRLRR
jgi:hypothetical protein